MATDREPYRSRAAARVASQQGGRRPPPRDWSQAAGWPLPPPVRMVVEQFAAAGPICGMLSALYWYHLQQVAPLAPDPARHAVIREALSVHGRFLHAYYITPGQHALWVALAAPGVAWLVLGVLGVAALGVRSHFRPRR